MNYLIKSCSPCPRRSTCTSPCRAVEALLPHEETGRVSGLQRRYAMLYGERLEARRALVRFMLDWRDVLKGRQKRAFNLRYNDGLTLTQIAARMNVTTADAGAYLRRARAKIRRAARR